MALDLGCATKEEKYGDGSTVDFLYFFELLQNEDLHVAFWDSLKKEYLEIPPDHDAYGWSKNSTPPTITFNSPIPVGQYFIIYRLTEVDPLKAVFHPGHPVKADDLNDNFDQLQFAITDNRCSIERIEDLINVDDLNNPCSGVFRESFKVSNNADKFLLPNGYNPANTGTEFVYLNGALLRGADYSPPPLNLDSDSDSNTDSDSNSNSTNSNSILYSAGVKLNLFIDDSGSMNTTKYVLNDLVEGQLQEFLLPFYGNNVSLYEDKVNVVLFSSERTFEQCLEGIVQPPNSTVSHVINIIFQDESTPYGSQDSHLDSDLIYDMNALHAYFDIVNNPNNPFYNSLPSYSEEFLRTQIMQVENLNFPEFKNLLQAVETGSDLFTGVLTTKDISSVKYTYDVLPAQSIYYYLNLIINTINNLGYTFLT